MTDQKPVNTQYTEKEMDLARQLAQTQQMLLTVIYAQPEHQVTLKEADFDNLPNFPVTTQTDHGDGSFTLTVDAKPTPQYPH